MEDIKTITGTGDEIWKQVTTDLVSTLPVMDYHAILKLKPYTVMLDIDVDPGGGFESGYAFTRFNAMLNQKNDFRFLLHHEDILDKIGKVFGMEDIQTGYDDFDKKVIVKTNDAVKAKAILAETDVRQILQSLNDFTLRITRHYINNSGEKQSFLELEIEHDISDLQILRKTGNAFVSILSGIDSR